MGLRVSPNRACEMIKAIIGLYNLSLCQADHNAENDVLGQLGDDYDVPGDVVHNGTLSGRLKHDVFARQL